jgi:hypothetical protein
VPSANTLVRWVNENAFAFTVQARPCPTFGRPVHLRGSPHRLQPGTSPHALRIPPHDGHPALQELQSGGSRSALVCFRLSPSCPFRPLHAFHSSRPARHYPRFWIRRSSSERRRDLNPPDQTRCSAHTADPSVTLSPFPRLPGFAGYTGSCSADFATGRGGLLQLLGASLSSCCRYRPARVSRRIGQLATFHAAFALATGARPLR